MTQMTNKLVNKIVTMDKCVFNKSILNENFL